MEVESVRGAAGLLVSGSPGQVSWSPGQVSRSPGQVSWSPGQVSWSPARLQLEFIPPSSLHNTSKKITKRTSVSLRDITSSLCLYTNLPGLMVAGWRSFTFFICMVEKQKKRKKVSLSFHFPHKSGIPLPVKVGRLSACLAWRLTDNEKQKSY